MPVMLIIKLNKLLILFLSIIFMFIIMVSGESPLMMWVFMELSNLMFIMMFSMLQNNNNATGIMILMQFFSSSTMLMGIIEENNNILSIGATVKLGMFPAHNWMPMITFMSEWKLNMLTLTLPKIAPFLILDTLVNNSFILMLSGLSSIIITIKMIKSNSAKILMALSSINNSSWMILSQSISSKLWMVFFSLYSINTIFMCYILSNNLYKSYQINKNSKMAIMTLSLSLVMAPPMLTFMSKLYTLKLLMIPFMIVVFPMVLSSSISMMYYSRIFMKMIFMNKNKPKFSIMKVKFMNTKMIMFFSSLLLII